MHKNPAVFVAGGSRGIGRACVKHLAKLGYNVVFTYNNSYDEAKSLVKELGGVFVTRAGEQVNFAKATVKNGSFEVKTQGACQILQVGEVSSQGACQGARNGGYCCGLAADVRCDEEVERAVRLGCEVLGVKGFDGVVFAAGVSQIEPFDLSKGDHWENIIETNLKGCANVLWAITPFMIGEKRGSIVLISSVWGQIGASCEVVYSASKGGVESLGKSLAKELGPSNIRVNCVAPGMIDTDMNKHLDEAEINAFLEEVPLGRIGKPEEVANLVEFLISDLSLYITGQVINIDGGI
ncbi:SDR family oxidoreductase [Eubacteriales bacterium KG125]